MLVRFYGFPQEASVSVTVHNYAAPGAQVGDALDSVRVGTTGWHDVDVGELADGLYTLKWPDGEGLFRALGGADTQAKDFIEPTVAEVAAAVRANLAAELAEISASAAAVAALSPTSGTLSEAAVAQLAEAAAGELGGDGMFTIPLTIRTAGGTVIPACEVVLTTNAGSPSTGVVVNGTTGVSGQVSFELDAGTYYIWRQKAGVNFSNPATLVVAADGTATVS